MVPDIIPGPFILYVGSLDQGCNSYMRYKALKKLGGTTKGIDIEPYIFDTIFLKFHYHLNIGPGISALNKKILNALNVNTPDILLVDNKPYITSFTLKKIKKKYPAIKIINLITDDPEGRYKRTWKIFRSTLRLYDILFVQRVVNINELKARGAKRVELCLRSFDPTFHRPMVFSKEEELKYHTNVGFIGNWESAREECIVYLIKKGLPVKVTGNNWEKGKDWPIIKNYFNSPGVYGDEYIRIINGMDIALHFLRHANRDEQDSRTFEIPACGTFMLAEKSEIHLSLFEEGKEAVYFETKEELLRKVKYYLDHDSERKAIAKAGYHRCISSGYSHEARLENVINKTVNS